MSTGGPLPGMSAYYDLFQRWHFRGLLLLLLGLLFVQPFVALLPGGRVIFVLLNAAIFSGALWAIGEHGGRERMGQIFVAIWAAFGVLAELIPGTGTEIAAALAAIPLTITLAWSTFAALFLINRADLDALAGAIFGYFVLALLFATLFRTIELLAPGSFSLTSAENPAGEFLYLSLITITTLGYGDVLPVSPTARMLAGVEAAFGTLYIAILIGRIVGALKPMETDDEAAESPRERSD